MTARVKFSGNFELSKIARSDELAEQLEPVADAILSAARSDPNEVYVASLRKRKFTSRGRRGRVSWQVGAAPVIGRRVEAKRGTLARVLARLGF